MSEPTPPEPEPLEPGKWYEVRYGGEVCKMSYVGPRRSGLPMFDKENGAVFGCSKFSVIGQWIDEPTADFGGHGMTLLAHAIFVPA